MKSSTSEPEETHRLAEERKPAANSWLRLGAVAAASAVLGGLAAAWFYRKTLSQLREAEDEIPDSFPESTADGTQEDF